MNDPMIERCNQLTRNIQSAKAGQEIEDRYDQPMGLWSVAHDCVRYDYTQEQWDRWIVWQRDVRGRKP